MGVQGLWTLLGPAARPVQLESLRNRKMAVDASIWIHQFMRTMRDKEGNALRNGHLLGFFRRLLKLLFFNIKPVFVFDGGAPALKRSTIRDRRRRREGVVTSMRRTAEKILSAQVKSHVLAEEERRRRGQAAEPVEEANEQAKQSIQWKKRDQFELPPLASESVEQHKDDPRLATREELLDFIEEFKPADQDIDSEAFFALPPEIQYEIVQDLKLKSRQTSWARLEEMVRQSRTALDFSKQQIKLLVHRNDMTQRMMQINERDPAADATTALPTRIAGQRGREYILTKNEDVSSGLGWKLPGMTTENPIHVDAPEKPRQEQPLFNALQIKSAAPQLSSAGSGDKVKDAVASNPKLAALFADVESDEDVEADADTDEDDEPLFLSQPPRRPSQPELMSEENPVYPNDAEVLNQVINRIYEQDEQEELETMEEQGVPEELLSASDFLAQWQNKTPDAFIYLHSFNDEYKHLLRDAIFNLDVSALESQLARVQKQLGKSSGRDEIALESLSFHEAFLTSVLKWKRAQPLDEKEDSDEGFEEVEEAKGRSDSTGGITDVARTAEARPTPMVLDDEEDEDGIRLMPLDSGSNMNAAQVASVPSGISAEGVKPIDFSLTSLQPESKAVLDEAAQAADKTKEKDTPHAPSPDVAEEPKAVRDVVFNEEGLNKTMPESQSQLDARATEETKKEEEPNAISILEPTSLSEESVVETEAYEKATPLSTKKPEPAEEPILPQEPKLAEEFGVAEESGVVEELRLTKDLTLAEKSGLPKESTLLPEEPKLKEEPEQATEADTLLETQNETDEASREPNTVFTTPIVDTEDISMDTAAQTTGEEKGYHNEEAALQADQGYNSDEELLGTADAEEAEYAHFVSDISDKALDSVRAELDQDLKELNKQQRKEMGNTDDITDQMVRDIQEMLRLFGIPYVVSPMEAEAQCAELVRQSLVEGIVTDDSDVFLFGATRIYKNMFNQRKYVECYVAQDIEREMQLDRRKLIQLAFLLGSDYTDGIPGIGPVAAMEILAEFSDEPDEADLLAPLRRFRAWYFSGGAEDTESQRKLRKKHKNLDFPEDFPNPLVVEAYYAPMVDDSPQPFEWGVPELDSLRLFMMESFSWPEKKADEVLVPVIREMNKRKSLGQQTNIHSYFDSSAGMANAYQPHQRKAHSSKRVQNIVDQWRTKRARKRK
ncbi:hypothetical protein BCR43DRAFT_492882 [Syncephalastrum racemosum]|uniref:PIN domain-like protein n=1 Tax=Syncephalastrum racemosum TaxID=13706 RepID=A0A1X2H9Q4_SYNRA|nr:hypothetical protein BCR43DRAFT_492882 [Syncephalastrum racemosum]